MTPSRRLLRTSPFLALPWLWFAVRDLHPAADVVALGLPVLVAAAVVACVAVAAIRRAPLPLLTAASWLLFGLVAVVGPWVPRPGDEPTRGVRVVAANVFGNRPHPPSIMADISSQEPDLVVVSELGVGVDEAMGRRYRHVVRSRPRTAGRPPNVGLFTDLPVTALELPDSIGPDRGVRVRVEGPAGPFVVYGLHLPPPRVRPSSDDEVSVREYQRIVEATRDAVAAETLPVVVAGDLNLVDRTSSYRQLLGVLDDAMRDTWLRPTASRTSVRTLLGRVDHVLAPEGWCSTDASVFELLGSDHRGVAATIGPCP